MALFGVAWRIAVVHGAGELEVLAGRGRGRSMLTASFVWHRHRDAWCYVDT